MRFDCDLEGFEGCFVEYSESWSVRQHDQYQLLKGEEFVSLLRDKTVAVSLTTLEGFTIDSPDAMQYDTMAAMDLRLFYWWIDTAKACVEELKRLGEASRRSSSAMSGMGGQAVK
jgi:hypothetical protein